MYSQIFVEKNIRNNERTQTILSKVKSQSEIKYIDKIEDVWGRVKKPYLQKRVNLNLFIGEKKGDLVKEAPNAYGTYGDPHYYFIHAYNCIYECTYCYLQGYFNTPDMVLFTNHEEILEEMDAKLNKHNEKDKVWFHAGEYSDSLAISHVTGELPLYFDYFRKRPQAMLELRTKSANIRALKENEPCDNIITSFSMAPDQQIQDHDLKTPGLKIRLKAMQELSERGHPIALHFDPIIYNDSLLKDYASLLDEIQKHISLDKIRYLSLGVVRFTKDVYYQVQKNYPESSLHQSEFIKTFDGKIRYNRPMRMWILSKIKQLCIDKGFREDQIYLCMEDTEE